MCELIPRVLMETPKLGGPCSWIRSMQCASFSGLEALGVQSSRGELTGGDLK